MTAIAEARAAQPFSFQAPDAGVQHLPVYGLPAKMICVRHALLRIDDADKARQWLNALLDGGGSLADGRESGALETVAVEPTGRNSRPAGEWALNLGFSFAGLQALGLPQEWQQSVRERAPAFATGAVLRAAARLGDTGDSAAWRWERPFAPDHAHLLLTLHAPNSRRRELVWLALSRLPGADGLSGWSQQHDGRHLIGRHLIGGLRTRLVHFGYVDGIANPRFEGVHQRSRDEGSPALHAPGELLLGHKNNDGANPWRLPALPAAASFFRDASFGVFRKIAQDEEAFRNWVRSTAAQLGTNDDWVKAKLCGRWPDGRLLRPTDAAPDAMRDAPGFDAFDFHDAKAADAGGSGCPFGSHIRRLNPRGDTLVQPQRRPLMRRGMAYGPRYAERTSMAERGLLGLFFCASLEDQFEHLLGAWTDRNPLGPDHRGTAKDPLIGQHDDLAAWFELPGASGQPPRRVAAPSRPFATTRGTAYLLYLTAPALRRLARKDFDGDALTPG